MAIFYGTEKQRTVEVENNIYANKKLLTVKEVAAYLGMGETGVRKWLAEPTCTFVFRRGGRIYANKGLLDKYIDQHSGR